MPRCLNFVLPLGTMVLCTSVFSSLQQLTICLILIDVIVNLTLFDIDQMDEKCLSVIDRL